MTFRTITLTISEEDFNKLRKRKNQMSEDKKKVVSWERFVLELCS